MSDRHSVLVLFGTRPEAIKIAPVVHALQQSADLLPRVVVTGQHQDLLQTATAFFEIEPEANLGIYRSGQSIQQIAARTVSMLESQLARIRPAIVLVQGDTTTAMASALAACYAGIPVAHLEAGLRTGNKHSPFPEEVNRKIVSHIADLHFAPTSAARANLLSEGIGARSVYLTGNTGIDALKWAASQRTPYGDDELEEMDRAGRRLLLVTAHRRESWDGGIRRIADGVRQFAQNRPDVGIVLPLHSNPTVVSVFREALEKLANVRLLGPLGYGSFSRLMQRSHVILTDSGGIQEEAPALGIPVLVAREETERPEVIESGAGRLVGTDPTRIAAAIAELFDDDEAYAKMSDVGSPFGDGVAAARVVQALGCYLQTRSTPPTEFSYGGPKSVSTRRG